MKRIKDAWMVLWGKARVCSCSIKKVDETKTSAENERMQVGGYVNSTAQIPQHLPNRAELWKQQLDKRPFCEVKIEKYLCRLSVNDNGDFRVSIFRDDIYQHIQCTIPLLCMDQVRDFIVKNYDKYSIDVLTQCSSKPLRGSLTACHPT